MTFTTNWRRKNEELKMAFCGDWKCSGDQGVCQERTGLIRHY